MDPKLERVTQEIDRISGVAAIVDEESRLVWVSRELRAFLLEGEGITEADIGYGRHIIENYMSPTWARFITDESKLQTMREHIPYLMHDTPGGKAALRAVILRAAKRYETEGWPRPSFLSAYEGPFEELVDALLETIEPREPPLIVTGRFEFLQGDLPPTWMSETTFRMHDGERFLGNVLMYAPAMSPRIVTLVARGDEGMLTRMARLIEPGRRAAAILFADLQESGALSRRLPSAAYFRLIRALTTTIDQIVVDQTGIVGKHAGDGATAFFLADDLGSPSAAARAAIQAARLIQTAAGRVAKEVGESTGLIEAADCRVNVGVHWGGTLYMGQLVTGGRLEVTALGDAVNECARIQECAREGEALASKMLIEHLVESDADAIGFDPDAVVYRTVSELPSASGKAVRDAGGIPVTVL